MIVELGLTFSDRRQGGVDWEQEEMVCEGDAGVECTRMISMNRSRVIVSARNMTSLNILNR